jgi:hypothetical protein
VKALAAVVALAVFGLQLAAPGAPAQNDAPASCATDAFRDFAMHAGSNVDVWYDPGTEGGEAAAARVAGQIDGKIWPAFSGLLGRTPPPDDGQACFHGPDGKLDVYLTTARKVGPISVPRGTVAFAHPFSGEPCAAREPDYLVARPGAPRWVIAHELFHAFQAAYGRAQHCIFYHEWEEATATWAGDFVYRRDNIEHNHPGGIERPEINLDFWGYGTWVFPYYLTKKYNDPKIIRRIEEAGEVYPSDAHVDQAIPGGFRERFPEFALYAWNQAPLPRTDKIKRSFRQWDDIPHVPRPGKKPVKVRKLRLGGAKSRTEPWPARLRVLGRDYRHYSVVDDKLRYIRFDNPSSDPNFGVTAFVRLARKGWRVQTWTARNDVEFCRDYPDEDVRELIVAFSNAGYGGPLHADPKLKLERRCPGEAFLTLGGSGTVTRTFQDCDVPERTVLGSWRIQTRFPGLPYRIELGVPNGVASGAGTGGGALEADILPCTDLYSHETSQLTWEEADPVVDYDSGIELRLLRKGGGLDVEVYTGGFALGGDRTSVQPYGLGLTFSEFEDGGCKDIHGVIPPGAIHDKRITVAVSGRCEVTAGADPVVHSSSEASGTLTIRR